MNCTLPCGWNHQLVYTFHWTAALSSNIHQYTIHAGHTSNWKKRQDDLGCVDQTYWSHYCKCGCAWSGLLVSILGRFSVEKLHHLWFFMFLGYLSLWRPGHTASLWVTSGSSFCRLLTLSLSLTRIIFFCICCNLGRWRRGPSWSWW